jgi:hypothetical protein
MRTLLRSLAVALVLMFLIQHSGCKKDEPKSGVVGTVTVEGGSADGVTVMLFDDPSRSFDETTVWYTTARQPSVGFRYDPKAAFEWRSETGANGLIAASAVSGADGKFNISDVPNGEYILVAKKPGFGWTAPLNVVLNEPSKDVGTLQLYAEEELSGSTTGSRTLLADHHYVVPESELFRVQAGDTLYIEPGVVIRGNEGADIRVYGSLIATGQADNWITFTTNSDLMQDHDWEGIRFQHLSGAAQMGSFSYCRFEFCADAIQSDAASITVDHCYFANIFGLGVDGSTGKNTIVQSVFNGVSSAIRSYAPDSLRIENNILFSARQTGIEIKNLNAGLIHCNWFHNCGRFDSTSQEITGVIYLEHVRHLDVTHNNSQESWYALNLGSGVDSTVHIRFNRFDQINRVMDIRSTAGGATPSFPDFNYNCMTSIDNVNIFLHSCDRNTENIDATNNFWGTTNPSSIASRIHDGQDDGNCPMIFFQPYLTECPPDNGICAQ